MRLRLLLHLTLTSKEATPVTAQPLNSGDASLVHYTDPRVRALAYTRWHLTTGSPHTDWLALGKNNPAALIEEARDWLRAAIALGLLPLVEPSTGRALSTVPLSVDPSTGAPSS